MVYDIPGHFLMITKEKVTIGNHLDTYHVTKICKHVRRRDKIYMMQNKIHAYNYDAILSMLHDMDCHCHALPHVHNKGATSFKVCFASLYLLYSYSKIDFREGISCIALLNEIVRCMAYEARINNKQTLKHTIYYCYNTSN